MISRETLHILLVALFAALIAISSGLVTAHNGWEPPIPRSDWVRP